MYVCPTLIHHYRNFELKEYLFSDMKFFRQSEGDRMIECYGPSAAHEVILNSKQQLQYDSGRELTLSLSRETNL